MDENELCICNTRIVTVGPQNSNRKWSRLNGEERLQSAFLKYFASCSNEKVGAEKVPATTHLCKIVASPANSDWLLLPSDFDESHIKGIRARFTVIYFMSENAAATKISMLGGILTSDLDRLCVFETIYSGANRLARKQCKLHASSLDKELFWKDRIAEPVLKFNLAPNPAPILQLKPVPERDAAQKISARIEYLMGRADVKTTSDDSFNLTRHYFAFASDDLRLVHSWLDAEEKALRLNLSKWMARGSLSDEIEPLPSCVSIEKDGFRVDAFACFGPHSDSAIVIRDGFMLPTPAQFFEKVLPALFKETWLALYNSRPIQSAKSSDLTDSTDLESIMVQERQKWLARAFPLRSLTGFSGAKEGTAPIPDIEDLHKSMPLCAFNAHLHLKSPLGEFIYPQRVGHVNYLLSMGYASTEIETHLKRNSPYSSGWENEVKALLSGGSTKKKNSNQKGSAGYAFKCETLIGKPKDNRMVPKTGQGPDYYACPYSTLYFDDKQLDVLLQKRGIPDAKKRQEIVIARKTQSAGGCEIACRMTIDVLAPVNYTENWLIKHPCAATNLLIGRNASTKNGPEEQGKK